jgi:hypothetical protein
MMAGSQRTAKGTGAKGPIAAMPQLTRNGLEMMPDFHQTVREDEMPC